MSEFISEADVQAAVARLSFLSTRFRRDFFGRDRLRRIETIEQRQLTPDELLEIIVREKGVQLLADTPRRIGSAQTSVRRKLLEELDDLALRSLFGQLRPNRPIPSQSGRIVSDLSKFKWHRGSASTHLFVQAFSMPHSFAGVREFGKKEKQEEILPGCPPPSLHPFQQSLQDKLRSSIQQHRRVMLSSFTGTGKTRVAIEHICELLNVDEEESFPVIFWVAQKAELLEQAIDSIVDLWPYRNSRQPLSILRYFGGNQFSFSEIPQVPTVVFATSQQLTLRLATDPFLKEMLACTLILVIDEAHYALADGHRKIIESYHEYRSADYAVLGLTATPGRSDIVNPDESRKLAQLFDGCLVIPDVAKEGSALLWFQHKRYLSTIDHQEETLPSQISQTFGKLQRPALDSEGVDFTQEVLTIVGKDSVRNRAIRDSIIRLVNDAAEHKVLVFCCSIEQTTILLELLTLHGISVGVVHSKIDRRDRRATIEKFRKNEIRVLLNVEVLTTGFDDPEITALVMCRPTLSAILYEQMLGRGLRGPKMGGTDNCLVLDFTDNFPRYDRPMAWERFWQCWDVSATADTLAQAAPDVWTVERAVPKDEEDEED